MISDEPFDITWFGFAHHASNHAEPVEAQDSSRARSRDENFPKVDHLLKTKDFRRVYRNGAFFKMGGLVFYHLANTLNKNRIGFSVPARNIGLAARRNRLRRLFKEVYRKKKNYLTNGCDMVLVIKRDLGKSVSYKDAEEIFLKLVKKAGLLV